MKKVVLILALLIIMIIGYRSNDVIVIPNEAIRIRVIANSNDIYDQNIKNSVKKDLQKQLNELLGKAQNINEVREILNKNMEGINYTIENTLKSNNTNSNFIVNYGLNYFPSKVFKGIEYKEGYYESVLITLGNGEGNNWWCVLFPPLCLTEYEEESMDNIEYKSFIKEILNRYL